MMKVPTPESSSTPGPRCCSYVALRSQAGPAGSDLWGAVSLATAAVVEQQSQPVVAEVSVAAGDPLGGVDLQVEVLGGSIGGRRVVEVGEQLAAPGVQGASEAGELGDRAAAQPGDQL